MPELTQLFRDHAILHQKHIFNNALLNLPPSRRELVPLFYSEVTKLGIQPNATAVAKVMRVLGKMQRESDAKALWRDWLVCLHRPQITHLCCTAIPIFRGYYPTFKCATHVIMFPLILHDM